LKEIGFWDYSCPGHGSLERYSPGDWDVLLDDMGTGGFDSLVLGIKWLTTGYRSRLPWLDQDPACSAIASDNAVVHHALRGARQRGIRTWLLVVATLFSHREFGWEGGVPSWPSDAFRGYDLDHPGVADRIDALFSEVVDLFGQDADGIVVELEWCDGEAPHRVPIYDAWANANGRPTYKEIKDIRLEPRANPFQHWRAFTTDRRIATLDRIEALVRGRGFGGTLASLIEMENSPSVVMGNVDLDRLGRALPHWPVVTYDSIYDRRRNRLASMDFCVHQPRKAGLAPMYLTRGVMTFGIPADLGPTNLEEQWRLALEDARNHAIDTLWFMGSDARLDGPVCSDRLLPDWGFSDGRTARRRLMEMARLYLDR